MRVWVTKYALSSGIEEIEVEPCGDDGSMVKDPRGCGQYLHRPDWHVDRDEAVRQAEHMRQRKIASLRKQLAKLELREFA